MFNRFLQSNSRRHFIKLGGGILSGATAVAAVAGNLRASAQATNSNSTGVQETNSSNFNGRFEDKVALITGATLEREIAAVS